MTTDQLARGYHRKCVDRLAALEVLHSKVAASNSRDRSPEASPD